MALALTGQPVRDRKLGAEWKHRYDRSIGRWRAPQSHIGRRRHKRLAHGRAGTACQPQEHNDANKVHVGICLTWIPPLEQKLDQFRNDYNDARTHHGLSA
jgi:hypothetical protein